MPACKPTWLEEALDSVADIDIVPVLNGRPLTLGGMTMATRKPAENATEVQHAPAVMSERERRAALVPHFEGDSLKITHEQRDAMLDALATDHGEILRSTLSTAISGNLSVHGEDGDSAMNTALRLLVELRPQNALERMLVAQYVACDKAASQCLNIGFNTENDADGRRKYLNLGVQFQGLLVRQVEALAKLRNGGNQVVRVEHVTVESGAQAVIGNVTRGGGGAGGEQ